MSDHKSPLTIVGMTHTGKTKALISAAISHHQTKAQDGDITLVISNEMQPKEMMKLAGLESSEDATIAGVRGLYFVSLDNAEYVLENMSKDHERFLFIDCVNETSLSVDHNGLFVSFHETQDNDLNNIVKMGKLCGVTASNWGQ